MVYDEHLAPSSLPARVCPWDGQTSVCLICELEDMTGFCPPESAALQIVTGVT